jgi:hypothetical protein
MIRTSIAAAALALFAAATPGFAGQYDSPAPNAAAPAPQIGSANDRLMIVNGHTGRVIFDDRHDDQFCVIRRYVVGYDDYGRPIIRRSLNCR